MIADLGLSKQLTDTPTNSIIAGVVGYIDPWCFENKRSGDKKSDIYSLGILLWEITSGHSPYMDIGEQFISYRVGKGHRENSIEGTPPDYVGLYKKCWNVEPKITSKNLISIITNTIKTFDWNISSPKEKNDNDNNLDDTELDRLVDDIVKGFGVGKDEKESFKWYDIASKKGDINGHFEIGECYYNGIGIEKDSIKALEYYQLAADKGLNIALFNLAKYYYNNNISNKFTTSFDYYKKSAENGYVPSQYYVAKCYHNGYGNKKRNKKEALEWFRKYQENDGSWNITDEIKDEVNEPELVKALNEIVEEYKKNNDIGTTKKFDFNYILEKYKSQSTRIFNYLKDNQTSIQQHYEVVIGTFYKEGFGVKKDDKESFTWYNTASQKGDINGHFELGKCYYNGIGVEKDCKKALKYYQQAAEEGLNIALCNLAEYFKDNEDKSKAFGYYKKSAKGGFVQSCYYVANCYNIGYSKKRNIKKALTWFEEYQKNDGSWEISEEITKVEKQLTEYSDQKKETSLSKRLSLKSSRSSSSNL
ncbi:kinase-like domain-containing protein [Rhizophagus clarus]|uniref:Kinase-like domain-containing protein n=1 Tax=Rhizophagus clarus TaxID=94130 RepID=A0A8H3QL45_9GLOM|nr:kinase-like domain-containing protein [Rhizophagus clarus]